MAFVWVYVRLDYGNTWIGMELPGPLPVPVPGFGGGGVALAPTIKMEKKGGPMRRLLVRSWMSMWM